MASVIQSYLQGGSMSNRADTLARAEQDRARSATLLRIGVVCFRAGLPGGDGRLSG
jgi:hypothetical protein